MRPFESTAPVYDLLYAAAGKDYEAEAGALHSLVQARRPGAASLLDVACGTGAHLVHLRRHYEVAGVDLEPAMIREARRRLHGVSLTQGDMRFFDLGRTFDAVTCLFSAIAYAATTEELDRAVATMTRHLAPAGVLVVDGWVRTTSWRDPGTVDAVSAVGDGVAVARVARSQREGSRTSLELHHLVATTDGVEHIVETHHLTLFDDAEYRRAFARAGLAVAVEPSPHPDRDRYVGVKPHDSS